MSGRASSKDRRFAGLLIVGLPAVFLLCCILTFTRAFYLDLATPLNDFKVNSPLKEYDNSQLPFTILYPESWPSFPTRYGIANIHGFFSLIAGGDVTIMSFSSSPNQNLESFARERMENDLHDLSQERSEGQVVATQAVQVDGVPALSVELRITHRNPSLPLPLLGPTTEFWREVIFFYEQKAYVIQLQAMDYALPTLGPAFDKMVSSVKFRKQAHK